MLKAHAKDARFLSRRAIIIRHRNFVARRREDFTIKIILSPPLDINSAKSTARRKLKRNLDLRRFRAPSTQSQNTMHRFVCPFFTFHARDVYASLRTTPPSLSLLFRNRNQCYSKITFTSIHFFFYRRSFPPTFYGVKFIISRYSNRIPSIFLFFFFSLN